MNYKEGLLKSVWVVQGQKRRYSAEFNHNKSKNLIIWLGVGVRIVRQSTVTGLLDWNALD